MLKLTESLYEKIDSKKFFTYRHDTYVNTDELKTSKKTLEYSSIIYNYTTIQWKQIHSTKSSRQKGNKNNF